MPIFEDIGRDYHGPITAGETHFAYLNRSARPEVGKLRRFIDEILDRYPAAHRGDMGARLKSDDRTHEGALFELIVHELLCNAGHTIEEIEPVLEHTSRSPDFLVRAGGGDRFYLECAVATGQTDAEAAAERRLQHALQVAEAVPSPHHILSLEIEGRPTATLTTSRLKEQLTEWIGTLPKSDAAREAAPLNFEEHGVTLNFKAWKYTEQARNPDERSVGITSYGVRSSTIGADVRGALLRKAKRYGTLDAPYVVAVNTLELRSLEHEIFDVLLGSTRVVFRNYPDGRIETFDERAPDGIWTDGSRPRKQGLSAVWRFDGVTAWNPGGRSVQLVRNPWAHHPLANLELFSEEWNPVDGEFKKSGATATREALGLSENWPENV